MNNIIQINSGTDRLKLVCPTRYYITSDADFDGGDSEIRREVDSFITQFCSELIEETLRKVAPSFTIVPDSLSLSKPRQYNFYGDCVNFSYTVKRNELRLIFGKVEASFELANWLADNYGSRNGFMSSAPYKCQDFMLLIEDLLYNDECIITNNSKFAVDMLLTFCATKRRPNVYDENTQLLLEELYSRFITVETRIELFYDSLRYRYKKTGAECREHLFNYFTLEQYDSGYIDFKPLWVAMGKYNRHLPYLNQERFDYRGYYA